MGKHIEGDRRSLTDVRRRQPDLEGVGAENMSHVGRPAFGQDVDELEVGKGPDDGEQGRNENHPADRGDRDMEEPPEGIAPSMAAASCNSCGNSLEPGKNRNAKERDAAPDIGQADRCNGKRGVPEKN